MSRLMPPKLFRAALLRSAFCLGLCLPAQALDSLPLLSGDVAEGSIIRAGSDGLTLLLASGGSRTVAADDLAPDAVPLVEAWKQANPALSDVYMKFDKPPVPKRTVEPSRNGIPSGVSGMVSVGIVINDSGKVVEAKVIRSQHEALEEPTIEAVSRWVFEPARVGSNAVSCYIVVPVRFN